MNKWDNLVVKYPNMFKGYRNGFPGRGWYQLVYELCGKLSDEVVVLQVKEKFGGLRFYAFEGTTRDYELISNAEMDSFKICEACGDVGKLRNDQPWIKTLCDKHNKERNEDDDFWQNFERV